MKILIVAPHPDDEVLGCGGIIAKCKKAGHTVFVCIVTRGISELYDESSVENVRNEVSEAHQLLDVNKTFFLDFPAPKLDNFDSYKISSALNGLIKEIQAEVLYLPHRGDIHKDHRIVFEAGLVASRPINNCSINTIYAYETLSETEWAAPFGDDAFIPTVFINIENYLDIKKKAFNCYKSQVKKFPNPRSFETIDSLARFRGATVGLEAAEAFMLIRDIKKQT